MITRPGARGVGGRESDFGRMVGAMGGVGANVVFLKFNREAETQADLEGARLMAASGDAPRDVARSRPRR